MHVCDPRSDRSCKASYLVSGKAASTVLSEANRRGNFGSGSSPSGVCGETHPRHGRETRKIRALQSPSWYVRGLSSQYLSEKQRIPSPFRISPRYPGISMYTCLRDLGVGVIFFSPLCSL